MTRPPEADQDAQGTEKPAHLLPPLPLSRALVPLATLVIGFAAGAAILDFGTPLLVLVMLTAATVAGLQARSRGHDWDDIQRCCGQKVASVLPAILILLAIGLLIGTWVFAGTIPLMVFYGLQLVEPTYLVPTAFLATAAMSLVTGTSWGSAGTLGVALTGMAAAVDGPMAATAGAVVSGAYFGDKMSPLSDSTNICAIGAGAELYAHIRHMTFTAGPSFVLALVVYFSFASTPELAGELPATADRLMAEIDAAFRVRWPTLLPPFVVLLGVLARQPAVPAMALSSLVAMAVGVLGQGFQLKHALTSAVDGFRTSMVADLGLQPQIFGAEFQRLMDRGGLSSMTGTLLVILAAFLFAAGLDLSGALDTLLNRLLDGVRGVFGLIASTMTAGAILISLTSHGGVTALIIGGLFQKAYRQHGLAPQNLSRSMEDSVTIVEPLMPWTVSALFMATTLGVPTLSYAPWAVFCYGGPIFSLFWASNRAVRRLGIRRLNPNDQEL